MHGTVLVNGQGLSATTYGQSVLLGRSMTRKGRISQGTLRVKPLRTYPFPVIAHVQSVDVDKFSKLNALSVRKFTVGQSSMLQYDAIATVNEVIGCCSFTYVTTFLYIKSKRTPFKRELGSQSSGIREDKNEILNECFEFHLCLWASPPIRETDWSKLLRVWAPWVCSYPFTPSCHD